MSLSSIKHAPGILFTDHQKATSDGYFRIGNVALQIPPEEMSLKLVSNKDEVLPLRSKYALQSFDLLVPV